MNPNNIDWLHYQDIQISDVSIREQFNNAIEANQFQDAINLLNEKREQLKGKAFISDSITKIINGILALENFYNDNVTLFLTDSAIFYFNLVNNFKNKNEWNAVVTYNKYNFVVYNEEIYMAIGDPVIGEIPNNLSTNWLKLGLIGDEGVNATDVIMKYNWNENTNYLSKDLVVYAKDIYVAKKSNKGVTPGTDESTWLPFIITSKGKINVGQNPPDVAIQNTIWFETTVDPKTAGNSISGQMKRYRIDGTWEEMYPTTFFTLINGKEEYQPIIYKLNITIDKNAWSYYFPNDSYVYDFMNLGLEKYIKDSSIVEILYNGENENNKYYYSRIKLNKNDLSNNNLRLYIPKKYGRPNINIPITILIQ